MPLVYKKISELPLAENIEVGVDLLELVQGGQSKRVTISKLVDSAGDPIFYFGTDGKIGIGTNSPGATLEVNGEARLSNAAQMGSQNASLATKEYVDMFIGAPVYVSPSTETEIETLPDASANSGALYTYVKANSSYYPVLIKTTGGDTISGLSHVFLWRQNDCLKVVSDGSNWIIINNFKPYFYSGLIPVTDKTNIHYGNIKLIIDNISGTIVIGDKCTGGTDGSYGIVVDTDNSTYVELMELVDGSGGGNIFTDDETLAFDLSSATADVNMGTHAKDQDYYMYHGWNKNLTDVDTRIYISADGTANNYVDLGNHYEGGDAGNSFHQYDTDNVFPQIGGGSTAYVNDAGVGSATWTHYQCYVRMR